MTLNLDGDLTPVISVDFASVRRQQKELADKRANEMALTIIGVHAAVEKEKDRLIAALREIRKNEKEVVLKVRRLDQAASALAASIENQDDQLMKHVADAAEAIPGHIGYAFLTMIARQHISSSVDVANFLEVMKSFLTVKNA